MYILLFYNVSMGSKYVVCRVVNKELTNLY